MTEREPSTWYGRVHQLSSSSKKLFGGLGELNQRVKLHRMIQDSTTEDGKYETLNRLYKGHSSTSMNDPEDESRIKFLTREHVTRRSAAVTTLLLIVYFVIGVVVLTQYADLTVQKALLYCVYTMTSTGFGSVRVPLTNGGFLLFLIFFMLFGVACVTLMSAQLYLYISFEFSKLKKQEDSGKTSLLSSTAYWIKRKFQTSEAFRATATAAYLIFVLLLGSVPIMILENWTFTSALYFGSFCMTTLGYGDVVPKTQAGIWITIVWLPLNVTFVSIYMGNLARYFMLFGTAVTNRLYEKMIASKEGYLSNEILTLTQTVNHTVNSLPVHPPEPLLCTMQDVVELVLENFASQASAEETEQDDALSCRLQLHSPWCTSGAFHDNKVRKPSFALHVLMQERLISIIVQELASRDIRFYEKDSTFVVTMDSLADIAEKWKIPAGARDAFAQVVFEIKVYVGEKSLVLEGTTALLKLSPFDCHDLFSPLLASFEDAGTMEGWLACTEEMVSSLSNTVGIWDWQVTRPASSSKGEETERDTFKSDDQVFKDGMERRSLKSRVGKSNDDLAILARLVNAFDRSMEQKQAYYLARFCANRMIAVGALTFVVIYETIVTALVIRSANIAINEGLLWMVYTLTSAGFGSIATPTNDSFLLGATVNIYISISALAILIAQTYVYLEAQHIRWRHKRHKVSLAIAGRDVLNSLSHRSLHQEEPRTVRDVMRSILLDGINMIPDLPSNVEHPKKSRMEIVLSTKTNQNIALVGVLLLIWFVGAIPLVIIEGWSFFESLYFCTYALLTVGHGDLTPQTNAGTWFVVFWLPFNVLFVTLYLLLVANLFVLVRKKYDRRVERHLKKANIAQVRDEDKVSTQTDKIKAENLSSQTNTLEDASKQRSVSRHRRIKQNSTGKVFSSDGAEIKTARELLTKLNAPKPEPSDANSEGLERLEFSATAGATIEQKSEGNSDERCQELLQQAAKDDDFALRFRVLDRVARIICTQLLEDYDAAVEVDGPSLRVTVESLKKWIIDWKIPYRARQAYRDITFECLLFMGEKKLFDHGAGAILDLSVIEFIALFSPFVFALEKTSMKSWLLNTDELATDRLFEGLDENLTVGVNSKPPRGRRFMKNTVENYFPCNPGNAVRLQMNK